MAKVFKIDDFTITLEDSLFKEACRVYVLEPGNDEEEQKGNYYHLKNNIRAGICKNANDFCSFSYEEARLKYTDEEISKMVTNTLIMEIKINGGDY